MAGIFTRFTLRSLAQNRVRTAVTVVGIALSTALLAAVLTSVASVQQGLLERTMVTEGSWHVFSPDVPAQGIDALVESDAVTDLATFRDLGSAALAPDDANHPHGRFWKPRSRRRRRAPRRRKRDARRERPRAHADGYRILQATSAFPRQQLHGLFRAQRRPHRGRRV